MMGYLPLRNNSGVIFITAATGRTRAVKVGTPGSPDIIACSPKGQFIAIECKTKKGRLTKKQIEFIERINALGGKALVVRSLDDLIQFVEDEKQRWTKS